MRERERLRGRLVRTVEMTGGRRALVERSHETCDDCGHWRIAYNSCRNRHCPKCQGAAARTWLAARDADLVPVGYFHVVFTVPAQIADIAWQNKAVVYDLLYRAAADTMLTIAADLLASSTHKDSMALARRLLGIAAPIVEPEPDDPHHRPPCPCCGGHMIIIETFARWCQSRAPPAPAFPTERHAP